MPFRRRNHSVEETLRKHSLFEIRMHVYVTSAGIAMALSVQVTPTNTWRDCICNWHCCPHTIHTVDSAAVKRPDATAVPQAGHASAGNPLLKPIVALSPAPGDAVADTALSAVILHPAAAEELRSSAAATAATVRLPSPASVTHTDDGVVRTPDAPPAACSASDSVAPQGVTVAPEQSPSPATDASRKEVLSVGHDAGGLLVVPDGIRASGGAGILPDLAVQDVPFYHKYMRKGKQANSRTRYSVADVTEVVLELYTRIPAKERLYNLEPLSGRVTREKLHAEICRVAAILHLPPVEFANPWGKE